MYAHPHNQKASSPSTALRTASLHFLILQKNRANDSSTACQVPVSLTVRQEHSYNPALLTLPPREGGTAGGKLECFDG